ncbi:hypothetical protein FACS1894185_3170 [Betaproteobacteria bacterium]|nr:hypothetical protein FACS1894185_3170 [Betaproteobacteria bacterium]
MTALLTRITSFIGLPSLTLIVLAFGFALGYRTGATLEAGTRMRLQGEWAEERAALSDARAQALSRTLDIEREGEAIAHRLAAVEAERDQIKEDKNREITRLTTGRLCLSADAVRVLNAPAAGTGLLLPAPAAGLAVAPASFASDADVGGGARSAPTSFATDADVGHWAITARDQYDRCRGRIDALREWSEGWNGGSAQ